MGTCNRREFLWSSAGLAAGAALAGSGCSTTPAAQPGAGPALASRRPNIIIVLTDDQGYGDLGRHGNPVIQTPNLDRMYDQSVRLSDFYVSPTCAPTRCSLMTGRHEFRSGVTHTIFERERMGLQAVTFVQLLRQAGYATGVFGKWHLGDQPEYWPTRRGFAEMFIHGAGGIGQTYAGTCGDAPGNRYFDPVVLHNGTFEKTTGYCTDVFFAQALKWIQQVKGQQPFLAYITPNAPHAPLDCPPDYAQRYAGKVSPQAAKFLGMVTNIDDNVGKLLAKLAEWGLERDTLVIYMNDNGGTAGVPVFNAGLRAQKGSAYNGGIRAMSLWRWPGTLPPGDLGQLTAHVDLFPTLTALAGAEVPAAVQAQLDGFSLLPLLEGQTRWPDRMVFAHVGRWAHGQAPAHKHSGCSVRYRQWHLVRNARGCTVQGCMCRGMKDGAPWELYDVKVDPGEKQDQAAAQPDVVAEIAAAYDRWWAQVQPALIHENLWQQTAGQRNTFKDLYWKQYRGPGPNNVPPPPGVLD